MKSRLASLKLVSRSEEGFVDRREAGKVLGHELEQYSGKNAVVLGIPRGGMVVAQEVASYLGAELDVVICRKIGAPGNPEFAIGAVNENGDVLLDEQESFDSEMDRSHIEAEKDRALEEIARRIDMFRKIRPRADLHRRPVIVVDDGLATGATAEAALRSVRASDPSILVAAVPVASESAIQRIESFADEVVCLVTPFYFFAVGQFYTIFDQVSDTEVMEILRKA